MSRRLALVALAALLSLAQTYPVPHNPIGAAGTDCSQWSNLVGAYYGSDLGTVSSSISSWPDNSTSGYDMTNATGDQQPTVATMGSSKGASFDGTNDRLNIVSNTWSFTGVFTAAAVLSPSTIDGEYVIADSSGQGQVMYILNTGAFGIRGNSTGFVTITNASALGTSGPYIAVWGRDASNVTWAYVDDVDVSTSNSLSGTIDVDQIGARVTTTEPYSGDMGSWCLWQADHEASRTAIHNELAAEYD